MKSKKHKKIQVNQLGFSKSNRDVHLDLLKALAITMVVFFHNAQLNPNGIIDNALMMFCNSAVPIFFMVTGAVQLTREGTVDPKRHIKKVMVLYLYVICWKMIYAIFMHFFYHVHIDGSLSNLVNYVFLFQEVPGVSTGHFWYFQALITMYLILPLLRICKDEKIIGYLMLVLFGFSSVVFDLALFFQFIGKITGKNIPNALLLTQMSPFHPTYAIYILCMFLGKCIYEQKGKCFCYKKVALFSIGLGLVGLMVIKYIQSGVWTWQGVHIVSGYYYCSTLLIASGVFIFFVGRKSISKVEYWIGKNIGQYTLGIFFLHILVYTILENILYKTIAPFNHWYINLIESAVIVGVSAMCTVIFEKVKIFVLSKRYRRGKKR